MSNKNQSTKKKLQTLLNKEEKYLQIIKDAKARLAVVQKEIEAEKIKVISLSFLDISPDEFLEITENLQAKKIPAGEILRLISDGDFQKLQEIFAVQKEKK